MPRHLLIAVALAGLAVIAGCGPANEPTRFTPATAGTPATTTGATADRAAPAAQSAPPRNIEMH